MNESPPGAEAVVIDGKEFSVAGFERGSWWGLGFRYLCVDTDGRVARVCHAPPRVVVAAQTNGERIVYRWKEE